LFKVRLISLFPKTEKDYYIFYLIILTKIQFIASFIS